MSAQDSMHTGSSPVDQPRRISPVATTEYEKDANGKIIICTVGKG